jgi:hypothetical protein
MLTTSSHQQHSSKIKGTYWDIAITDMWDGGTADRLFVARRRLIEDRSNL